MRQRSQSCYGKEKRKKKTILVQYLHYILWFSNKQTLYSVTRYTSCHSCLSVCLLSRRHQTALLVVVVCPASSERLAALGLGVLSDASLEFWSEVADQALDWPGERLAESCVVYQYLCFDCKNMGRTYRK